MTIKITRSFSRTKQVAPYEPINSFCSAEMEVETDDNSLKDMERLNVAFSEDLDRFCQSEVEKTIAQFAPKEKVCDFCHGVSSTERVEADGLHPACKVEANWKIKNNGIPAKKLK